MVIGLVGAQDMLPLWCSRVVVTTGCRGWLLDLAAWHKWPVSSAWWHDLHLICRSTWLLPPSPAATLSPYTHTLQPNWGQGFKDYTEKGWVIGETKGLSGTAGWEVYWLAEQHCWDASLLQHAWKIDRHILNIWWDLKCNSSPHIWTRKSNQILKHVHTRSFS